MPLSDSPEVVKILSTPPDAAITKAIGQHHSIESAIADLIDNSIDANATKVWVRFLQLGGRAVGLQVIDNGSGMSSASIDDAMTFAKQRAYARDDLGHFGVGLKAASLSQCELLRVYSKALNGRPVARQIRAERPTELAVISDESAQSFFEEFISPMSLARGTVIEWHEPRTFLSHGSQQAHAAWLAQTIEQLLTHLGIVFHRLISGGRTEVWLDVFDTELGQAGPPRVVVALDPFGYEAPTVARYPAEFTLTIDHQAVGFRAHIWPARETYKPEFRLGGKDGGKRQGFFVYRNDRLLQQGGSWLTLATERPEFNLARVELEITDALSRHVQINPEKSGIEFDADLKAAIHGAGFELSGGSFQDYLTDATNAYAASKKRTKAPIKLVALDRGLSADLKRKLSAIAESADFEPVSVRWAMIGESAVRIDFERREIQLNLKYRTELTGTDRKDINDIPFIKTLLVLAFSRIFEGQQLGSRDKREIEAWEAMLTAALNDQIAQRRAHIPTEGSSNE